MAKTYLLIFVDLLDVQAHAGPVIEDLASMFAG